MRSVYIIFSTIDIGGAEKRFAGLWRSFKSNENFKVNLVMNPELYNKLLLLKEIMPDTKNVMATKLQGKNFWEYRKNVKLFIKKFTMNDDIIHFIGISPLLKFSKRKIIFSLTNSSLNLEGRNNKVVLLLSCLLANIIDILDPGVYKKIRTLFFWKRKNILRTTNSFTDTNLFNPLPFNEKKDWIVFLGRFAPAKQIEQFIKALPIVYENLKNIGKKNIHFFLLGYGDFSKEIQVILKSPEYRTIPFTINFEKQPEKILNTSKIFLSLQLYNNYPSKSLLEAMAAGNIPLVTDVGQTRWIAKPDFAYYVPEHFTGVDLAKALVQIFSIDDSELKKKMNAARQLILNEHTIEKMKDYYQNIYDI